MDKLDDLFRGFRSGVTAPSEDAVSAARELLLRGIGSFDHPRPSRPRRRRAFIAVAAALLVGGLLVTPAVGIGSRLLALIESAPGPREVQAPVWSSGGRQIAFLSRRGVDNFDLDVVNADGSGFNLIGDGSGMSGLSDGVGGNQVGSAASPIDPVGGAPGQQENRSQK
jgi:hypothetical protein